MVKTHVMTLVSAKRSLDAKVDLQLANYHAYFCTYAFEPLPPTGMEPIISNHLPLSIVQSLILTRYLPYTSTYSLETYSNR